MTKGTLRGKSPQATLAGVLTTENAKGGLFERTAPGTYRLRKQRRAKAGS